jgi:hypothetical protein
MNLVKFTIEADRGTTILTLDADNWSEEALFNFLEEHCSKIFRELELHEGFFCQLTELIDDSFELSFSGDNGMWMAMNIEQQVTI